MYGYIYETTCLINGKKYIGQHKAKKFDVKYIGSGKYLWNAIRKYGIENFNCKIIEECDSREHLNEREIYWIDFYNAVKSKNYYNITKGGKYHNPYEGLNKEDYERVCKKLSESSKGKVNINNGEIERRINPSELQEYLNNGFKLGQLDSHKLLGKRNGMYNKTHSDEVKEKLVKCNLGKNNPSYGKHWYTNGVNELYIRDDEYELYYKNIYKRGRLKGKGFTTEGCRKGGLKNKGTILVTNGIETKRIKQTDIEYYEKMGYIKGAHWFKNKFNDV